MGNLENKINQFVLKKMREAAVMLERLQPETQPDLFSLPGRRKTN
jgi:hypothetical protein